LGLAVPLVVAVSTSIAAKNGLLIRNRAAFETARHLDAIIFDKTGTLTQGKFGITDVLVLNNAFTAEKLLDYTANIEEKSEHPLARAISSAKKNHYAVESFQALPGQGVQGTVDGKKIQVVSQVYLAEHHVLIDDAHTAHIANLNAMGKTVVFTLIDNKLAGAIALADMIRPEAKAVISELKKMGIQCFMLTGDNQDVAKWVANSIGLDEYFAQVLPQDKANKVKEIQDRGLIVAMTGDGINDAPALAQADVGIAIGTGTDIAIETADIVLVKSHLQDVVATINLARATTDKIIQNLLWATGYNVVAIPLAAGVLFPYGVILSPAVGAILMSLSTVIVAINARLLKI